MGRSISFKARIIASKKALRAHQDHHVAGADAPALAVGDDAFGGVWCEPGRDGCGDAARSDDRRIGAARFVERHAPVLALGRLFRADRRPDFDHPGQVAMKGLMGRRRRLVGSQAAPGALGGEDRVDRFEHGRRRAERHRQRRRGEGELRLAMTDFQPAAHGGEHMRRGALEGEDRLLLVADGEDRAGPGAGAGARARAGKEFLSEPGKDSPLRGRSVLRLVDQQVFERSIELVEHPGGVGALEQRAGTGDEVVEVEPAARALERRVAPQHGFADVVKRNAALEGLDAAQLVAQPD